MNKEIEFNNIVNDILKCDKFIDLKYELHHGISRLDHSLSVAHFSYNVAKFFKLKNVEEVTRAALLHDFFFDDEIEKNSFVNHPKQALINAKNNFNLTEKQENIIVAHMFPLCKTLPKYKESYIVSLADKVIAIKEMTRYKLPLAIGASLVFLFNFVIIERYINW